jgi:hypothetical protein
MKITKREKTYKTILTFCLMIFFLSLGSKLVLCGLVTVKNGELQEIFSRRTELEKEVSRLSYVDSTLSSLSYVEGKAAAMGFINMNARLSPIDPKAPVQVAALSR